MSEGAELAEVRSAAALWKRRASERGTQPQPRRERASERADALHAGSRAAQPLFHALNERVGPSPRPPAPVRLSAFQTSFGLGTRTHSHSPPPPPPSLPAAAAASIVVGVVTASLVSATDVLLALRYAIGSRPVSHTQRLPSRRPSKPKESIALQRTKSVHFSWAGRHKVSPKLLGS